MCWKHKEKWGKFGSAEMVVDAIAEFILLCIDCEPADVFSVGSSNRRALAVGAGAKKNTGTTNGKVAHGGCDDCTGRRISPQTLPNSLTAANPHGLWQRPRGCRR